MCGQFSLRFYVQDFFFLFLVNDQRDAQILFYVFISIYNSMLVAEMYAGWKKTSSNLYTSRPPT